VIDFEKDAVPEGRFQGIVKGAAVYKNAAPAAGSPAVLPLFKVVAAKRSK